MLPRLLKPHDLSDLMRLKEAAGWNQTEEDWLRLLTLAPDGCFGFEQGGRIVSSATVARYGESLAWIGMVLTLPEYRGRGLARSLMAACLEYAGTRTVGLDASDMGRTLYESLGFLEECGIERWLAPKRSCAPLELPPYHPVASSELALDREVFGAGRERLLGSLAESSATATLGESGYAFLRRGSLADYFGPCVALSAGAAERLLHWALAIRPNSPCFWDLFPDHEQAVSLARQFGFRPLRRLTRMRRGPATGAVDPRLYAIAGFEWG